MMPHVNRLDEFREENNPMMDALLEMGYSSTVMHVQSDTFVVNIDNLFVKGSKLTIYTESPPEVLKTILEFLQEKK